MPYLLLCLNLLCFLFLQSSSSAPSTSTVTGPSKPTFPSAAAITSTATSESSSATITGAPVIKKPESSSGLTSKLMHPDEDISLVSFSTFCMYC